MKNKLRRIAAAAALCAGVCLTATGQIPPAITPDPEIEANIQKLLKKMTLDEKVGQMCEITIDVVTDFERSRDGGRGGEDARQRRESKLLHSHDNSTPLIIYSVFSARLQSRVAANVNSAQVTRARREYRAWEKLSERSAGLNQAKTARKDDARVRTMHPVHFAAA